MKSETGKRKEAHGKEKGLGIQKENERSPGLGKSLFHYESRENHVGLRHAWKKE